MIVEAKNIEGLVRNQQRAISAFFGAEVPAPSDRVLAVCEEIRQKQLWALELFFVPQLKLPEGVSFPGLKHPLSSVLYGWMREHYVDDDADMLPGQWIIWDTTRRPNNRDGKQMYPDTRRFKELLADLRERANGIEVPNYLSHVPKDSRFGISPDEIDGSKNLVAGEVAKILGLQEGEVSSTPNPCRFQLYR